MSTRSGVDEDTVLISGVVDKTRAGQELDGQHPGSSTHQEDKPLILPCKLEDTTDVNATKAINQIIDVELFTDHSSPISLVNDVKLNRTSYPMTIEGCIKVIDELRHH